MSFGDAFGSLAFAWFPFGVALVAFGGSSSRGTLGFRGRSVRGADALPLSAGGAARQPGARGHAGRPNCVGCVERHAP
jgi:hypothetical protein